MEGRQGVPLAAWKDGAHCQGYHGAAQDKGCQLPGSELLQGPEVCSRSRWCAAPGFAPNGGSYVLELVRDGCTAFLLAPSLFQEARPTLVQVPKMLLMGGVCKETIWHVKPALYGMVTSPRSREVHCNKTLARMRGAVLEGDLFPSLGGERKFVVHYGGLKEGRGHHLLRRRPTDCRGGGGGERGGPDDHARRTHNGMMFRSMALRSSAPVFGKTATPRICWRGTGTWRATRP